MFRDLSPSVLNFYSKGGSLKLSFTLSYVLKRANDNSDFKLTRFAFEFEAVPREQTSFPNASDTQEGYNNYLIYSADRGEEIIERYIYSVALPRCLQFIALYSYSFVSI